MVAYSRGCRWGRSGGWLRRARLRDGGAAGVDGADAVEGRGVGDGVAVYGEDVGVEAGGDAALAVPEADHVGRRGGEHPQRLGLPDADLAQLVRRVPDHVVRLDRADAGVA